MWISSFVVTLPDNPDQAAAITSAIQSLPVFETGQKAGCRLPVVLEAENGSAARHWYKWVQELAGVVNVDVAFVSFEDEQPAASGDEACYAATAEGTNQ